MGCDQSTSVKPIIEDKTTRILIMGNGASSKNSNSNGKAFHILQNGLNHTGHSRGGPVLTSENVRLMLKEYAETESKIAIGEKGDPLTMFYIKKSLLLKLDEKLEAQLEKVEALQKERKKEESFSFSGQKNEKLKDLVRKSAKKERLTKEEQDVITTTNRIEIGLTELEMLHQEKMMVEKEVGHLVDTLCTLKDQYQRQDTILEDLEISDDPDLQKSLADLEERRIKTAEIYERWREGRKLVSEACRQISNSLRYWREMLTNERDTFEVAEEIRDGFVTALQCLSNAKFFIRVDFPYCTGLEISTLEKAMAYLFIDLNRVERKNHAENCYLAFHKRAAALFAWIDKSIELVIEPDLKQLSLAINDKVRELRFRRMSFIKDKFPELIMSELLEKSFNFQVDDSGESSSSSDLNFQNSSTSTTSTSPASSSAGATAVAEGQQNQNVKYICVKSPDSDTSKVLNSLQMDKLAPLPTKYEIFEKQNEKLIEKIKAKIRESFMRRSTARNNFHVTVEKVLSIHRNNKLKARKNMIIMEYNSQSENESTIS